MKEKRKVMKEKKKVGPEKRGCFEWFSLFVDKVIRASNNGSSGTRTLE